MDTGHFGYGYFGGKRTVILVGYSDNYGTGKQSSLQAF